MSQLSSDRHLQNKTNFNQKFSSAELVSRKAKRMELGERCRLIFEKIRPQLRKDHENCFIAVEEESERYLIASQLEELIKKIKQQYPHKEVKMTIFRLNPSGTCGKIY